VDRITRKELKTDKFREEVAHTFEYVGLHRHQMVRYGAIVVVLILAVVAWSYYSKQKAAERQSLLHAATEIQNRQIGPDTGNEFLPTFPTVEARSAAAEKALNEVIQKFPGSAEAQVSYYYLGVIEADLGKPAEAEKYFKVAADGGDRDYASLAAFSLAQLEGSLGKTAEGERLLRALIEKPTVFVSKDQATIALAQLIATVRPNEARKLLEPLRTSKSSVVSRTALTTLAEFPPQ
jgi:TolA-binding protein